MQGEYEKYQRNGSYNIERFYLALESISKAHFADGTMQDGNIFMFPTSNGGQIKFKFYKDITEIYQYTRDSGEEIPLLTKRDYLDTNTYKTAQAVALKTMGTSLKVTSDHIGEQFPGRMIEALQALTPGAIISFTNGKSYVCTKRPASNIIELLQTYSGDVRNLTLEALRNPQKVIINTYDDIQLQKFYRDNQKKLTQRIELNVSFTNKAKEFVDLIERNVEINKPHRIAMGNVTLIAKKNKDNSVIWFDGKGERVEKKSIILLNGILNSGINERNYIRKNPTNMDIANDVNFEKNMENLSRGRKFELMYRKMMEYVKENKTNLAIETFQYEKNGDDFTPARIVFAERDGLVKAVKITYKDNDFSKEEDKLTELSESDFIKMCEQLYCGNHKVLATRTEEMILSKIKKPKEELTYEERKQMNEYVEEILKDNVKIIGTEIKAPDKSNIIALVQEYIKGNNPKEISVNKAIEDLER